MLFRRKLNFSVSVHELTAMVLYSRAPSSYENKSLTTTKRCQWRVVGFDCGPFAPRLRPVYTPSRILNTRTRTGPDSTGNHNNRRGLPQWEARCTVGPSAQWIFRKIAQTQANTEASPSLSYPAKHKGLFSRSRSFLREESAIVPTYGGH